MKKLCIPFLNPKFYISMVYYILGVLGNKKLKSINLFEKSLKYYPSQNHSYLCHKTIGVIYYYNDFFQKSAHYLHTAENLAGKDGGDTELFTFLGLIYYTEANYLAAKEYFYKALSKYSRLEWIKKDFIMDHLKAIEGSSGDWTCPENVDS